MDSGGHIRTEVSDHPFNGCHKLRLDHCPGQGEPGHLLAEGRKPGGLGQPSRAGNNPAGHYRRPSSCFGAIETDCGGCGRRVRGRVELIFEAHSTSAGFWSLKREKPLRTRAAFSKKFAIM